MSRNTPQTGHFESERVCGRLVLSDSMKPECPITKILELA